MSRIDLIGGPLKVVGQSGQRSLSAGNGTRSITTQTTKATQVTQAASILVVEDEQIVAMDLELSLAEMGYAICGTAATGEEAVRLARRHRPSLILMDVMLRGTMDGTEVAKAVGHGMRIPVIYLTAFSDAATVSRAVSTAPYGFLTKPYQAHELRAAIEVALYKVQMEQRLRDSEQWFAATLRCVGDSVIATDRRGVVTFMNPTAESLLGWSSAEATGQRIDTVMRLEDGHAMRMINPAYRALDTEGVVDIHRGALLRRRDGSLVPIDDSAAPLRDADGRVIGAVLVQRDVSERIRQEERLRVSEERFHNAFDLAASGMALVTLDGRFLQINSALATLLGYAEDELLSLTQYAVTVDQDAQLERAALFELLSGQKPAIQIEKRYRHRDGKSILWTLVSVSLLRDTGQDVCFLYQVYDVTARKAAEYRLAMMAYYDPLTGLSNRTRLREEFQRIIAQARRRDMPVAVCLLDLDRFKQVNDTLGHELGDELLVEVAHRLQGALRETDCVARLGGDEFVLLLPELEVLSHLQTVVEKLRQVLSVPITLNHREIVVTATIGIALYPADGVDLPALLRNADSALYAAKADGRDRVRLFQADLERQANERLELECGLRNALARNELALVYQPYVRLADNTIAGCEALLRWNHNGETLSPAQFLPIAEETGLILTIGEWVLQEACRCARTWSRPLDINVNCSPRQFREDAITDAVVRALRTTELIPARLCLEITEEAMLHSTDALLTRLRELETAGVRLAIDDYGTGYSSLAYIKRFAPSCLKIDAYFIRDLLTDRTSAEIVAATIAMAHKLGVKVIAEGVEQGDQARRLLELGCDFAQGYWFSRPVDSATVARLIADGCLPPAG